MSDMGELGRLQADLEREEGLRGRLDEALRRIAEEGKVKSDGEAMVAAAAELGYEIAVADLERASAEAEDVDDAELERVAGGAKRGWEDDSEGHAGWCATAWHCFTALLHSESTNHKEACWSNYRCYFVSEKMP